MGLEVSRNINLPTNVNDKEYRKKIIASWDSESIQKSTLNSSQSDGVSTLSPEILTCAAKGIAEYWNAYENSKMKILEVMCGNCCASLIIKEGLLKFIDTWKHTDIVNYSKRPKELDFSCVNTVDAVRLFGEEANILLLISPPPVSIEKIKKGMALGDYYAIHDFIEQTKKERFVIFVGELGASDGTEGMYKYLLNNEQLTLEHRRVLSQDVDMFGGPVIKELFIFKIMSL